MTDHLGVSNPESVPFLRKAHAKLKGNVVNVVKAFYGTWEIPWMILSVIFGKGIIMKSSNNAFQFP